MRLIDADALTERWNTEAISRREMYKILKDAPTIDAVEVVRCRECKYGKYEFIDNKDWIYCKHHYDYWTADDYCSYGKRR